MTQDHYNIQMGRIYSIFGDKSFGPERLTRIWFAVKDFPDHTFTKIINHFVETFRTPPLPKDFIEAAIRERHNLPRKAYEATHPTLNCNMCCDAYVFEVQHDNGGGEIYFVRCPCSPESSIHKTLPVWDELKHGFEFTKLPMGEKRFQDWVPAKGLVALQEKAQIWRLQIEKSKDFWINKGVTK